MSNRKDRVIQVSGWYDAALHKSKVVGEAGGLNLGVKFGMTDCIGFVLIRIRIKTSDVHVPNFLTFRQICLFD